MHPNWPLLRKPWITAVSACINPRDFARALIVLQACIKPVVFAPVWHEALGHVRMQRLTSAEREERKRLDKKDKKDKEEEEERNRLTYNFVKYTLGLKHMVYKCFLLLSCVCFAMSHKCTHISQVMYCGTVMRQNVHTLVKSCTMVL
jgi:hypothetical protein